MPYHLGADGPMAEAQEGMEAWRMLQETSFCLVMSDLNMPAMDGFKLLQRMRSSKKLQFISALLITG